MVSRCKELFKSIIDSCAVGGRQVIAILVFSQNVETEFMADVREKRIKAELGTRFFAKDVGKSRKDWWIRRRSCMVQ